MSNTSNLVLPFLAVGQAQKHVTLNESLRRRAAGVQLPVDSATTTVQPSSPVDGMVYIVPPGKTGADWAAFADGSLGYYRDGAWEQINPRAGWLAFVKDAGQLLVYTDTEWAMFAPGNLLNVSASDRVLGRISSGAGEAEEAEEEEVVFTDPAQQLCDDASFQAMCATLGTWRLIAAGAVSSAHTGDTAEAVLATIPVSAGAMGPNGILRVTLLWSYTNSASGKTKRVRLGGSSGTILMQQTNTTSAAIRHHMLIQNRNAQNAQIAGQFTGAFAASSVAHATATIDTSAAQDLVISGQLANAAETVTLESYVVELAYGA
jgi:hypothetical protein